MSGCVFCDVVAGEAPASVVLQSDGCTAFMDLHQLVNPGHVLVVPDEHAGRLSDLDPDAGARMFGVGQRVAAALYDSDLRCEGVNLWLADGEVAGQDVFHVHLHVFPRFEGDDFGLKYGPDYDNPPDRMELDAAAERIRGSL